MIDYAIGTTGAFALSAALYQTLRTGKGQYIDMAMLDVALILQGSHITDYFHSGHHPQARRQPDALLRESVDAAGERRAACSSRRRNARQHQRFYEAIGEPGEAERAASTSATRATTRSRR